MPVVGYEGCYEVSSLGRVKSVPRNVASKNGVVKRVNGGLMALSLSHGYLSVGLWKNNKGRTYQVHRLVAEAFLPNNDPKNEVCHGDGDRLNCRVSNLRWDTRGNNHLDAVAHGTHFNASKQCCPNGHRLSEPNLVAGPKRNGRRNCLACSRGKANARDWKIVSPSSVRELTDKHYKKIMGED